jgi:hypothetical protein
MFDSVDGLYFVWAFFSPFGGFVLWMLGGFKSSYVKEISRFLTFQQKVGKVGTAALLLVMAGGISLAIFQTIHK